MRYRYFTCDVFTDRRFGGNPLAVLPEAAGLADDQMQRIAREFNYSETTFVGPATGPDTWPVRIFTPSREVPFAGHPNIGTAFVLAMAGALAVGGTRRVTLEQRAGAVPIAVERSDGGAIRCELAAPQRLALGAEVPADLVATAAGLAPSDVRAQPHAPRVASVGLPFAIAELVDTAALARARPVTAGCEALAAAGHPPDVHLYVRGPEPGALRARMFAPVDGVPEDPATGSAGCALAGLLAHLEPAASGDFAWRIEQGLEMGRPSRLDARVEKRDGEVTAIRIGGFSVMVAEGWIEAD